VLLSLFFFLSHKILSRTFTGAAALATAMLRIDNHKAHAVVFGAPSYMLHAQCARVAYVSHLLQWQRCKLAIYKAHASLFDAPSRIVCRNVVQCVLHCVAVAILRIEIYF